MNVYTYLKYFCKHKTFGILLGEKLGSYIYWEAHMYVDTYSIFVTNCTAIKNVSVMSVFYSHCCKNMLNQGVAISS